MGSDFIEKVAPACKKSWDRARLRLATAGLFTDEPSCAPRTIAGDIVGDEKVALGEGLTVETEGRRLVARRGLTEVVRFNNPPPEVMRAVEQSCGVASGRVEEVHELARVVEISLC
jgi:hypothetical protein